MALAKLGAIVTALSGKIGGQVFANSSNGAYIKNIGSYINKTTPKRKESNAALAYISGLWKTASVAQQSAWNALAATLPYKNRVGDTAYYSGFNLFVQFNYNLFLIGKAANLAAPAASAGVAPTKLFIVDNSGNIELSTVDGDAGVICKVFAATRLSYGNTQYRKIKRLITCTANGNLQATYVSNTDYENVFGDVLAKGRIWFEIDTFDQVTGQPLGAFVNSFIDLS